MPFARPLRWSRATRRMDNEICHGESPIRLSLAIIRWAGAVTDAIDGKSMDVDWVRVWQRRPQGVYFAVRAVCEIVVKHALFKPFPVKSSSAQIDGIRAASCR